MAKPAKNQKAKATPAAKQPALKMIEFTGATAAQAIAATGASKSGKLLMVPPDQIFVVPGFNLRITDTPAYKAGIEELAESIKTEGFYDSQPLGCFPADVDGDIKMCLISGHRRYEAAMLAIEQGAEIERLPVVLKPPTSSDIDLAVSLHKENTGVQPSMMERAVLTHRMRRSGMDDNQIAGRLNVSARHVSDLNVIIAAPRAVRDLIKRGIISGSEAVLQLRKDPTGEKILAAAEKIEAKAAEKAEKSGNTKLTRSKIDDADGGDEPKVKMQTMRMNFAAAEGATFLFEDVEPFIGILGDDWFKNARKKAERIALEPVEIEVKIRRPKSAEETEAEATPAAAAPVEKVAKGKGGKKAPPAAEAEADDDLTGGDDDLTGDDDAPDLRALGVADPVGAEAEL